MSRTAAWNSGLSANHLLALLKRSAIARFAGAHDGMSARLAQDADFDGVWISGCELATSFALPDADVLTLTQHLDAARVIRRVCSIPVIADCNTGFGDTVNVAYAVREYETIGVDAICIEDKAFPKLNSFIGDTDDQSLLSAEAFALKVDAAKTAQRKSSVLVIARTEALVAGKLVREAVERAELYVEAGADAIIVHSRSTSATEIWQFLDSWNSRAPVLLIPTTYPQPDSRAALARGCRGFIYANHGIRAAVRAIQEVFARILRDGESSAVEQKLVPLSTLFDIQGMSDVLDLRARHAHAIALGEEPMPGVIHSRGQDRL